MICEQSKNKYMCDFSTILNEYQWETVKNQTTYIKQSKNMCKQYFYQSYLKCRINLSYKQK